MMEHKEKIPIVTVVMPAYNAEKTIGEAIESVLSQTEQNWELLVLDDMSTDITVQIAKKYEEKDSRIRVVTAERNQGPAAVRNLGFQLARGSYIALLDSDDLWYPEKLSLQLKTARETGADIVYCSYEIVGEDSKPICADFIVPEATDFKKTLVSSVISCSTALLSSRVTQRHSFPEGYYHEDYVYWLTLLREGYQAVGVRQVLGSYRVVGNSRASNKLASAVRRWRVYRDYLNFNLLVSAWYLMCYAFRGVIKYKRV